MQNKHLSYFALDRGEVLSDKVLLNSKIFNDDKDLAFVVISIHNIKANGCITNKKCRRDLHLCITLVFGFCKQLFLKDIFDILTRLINDSCCWPHV